MAKELRQVFGGFLRGSAGQLRARVRPYAVLAMARVARFAVVNFLPRNSGWIEDRNIRRRERTRRRFRFERLAHEPLRFFVLFCDLFRDRRIELILMPAQPSKGDERRHYGEINSNSDRAPPRPPFQAPVEKGKTDDKDGGECRDDDNADDRERALEVFQPLEHRQVGPFWARDVLGIGRIRFWTKLRRRKIGE